MILVFSADELRGNIIGTVLGRSGIEFLLFNRMLEADSAIAQHTPDAVIFDTNGCFADELNHLINLSQTLDRPAVLLLGDATVIGRFHGPAILKDRCLPDPLDPGRIVAKIKEMSASPEVERVAEIDSLEEDLKGLLNL